MYFLRASPHAPKNPSVLPGAAAPTLFFLPSTCLLIQADAPAAAPAAAPAGTPAGTPSVKKVEQGTSGSSFKPNKNSTGRPRNLKQRLPPAAKAAGAGGAAEAGQSAEDRAEASAPVLSPWCMGIMLFLVFAYPVVQGLLLLQGREGVRVMCVMCVHVPEVGGTGRGQSLPCCASLYRAAGPALSTP